MRINRRRMLSLAAAAGATTGSVLAAAVSVTRSAAAQVASTPSAASRRLRRWAMVIDLRKCDGCQGVGKPPQCTEACIQGHFAPKPMEWIQVYEAPLHGGGTQFVPTPCQQCQNPPCTNACPVGATFSTPEGVVLIDQQRCIGCRICLAMCPFDRRFFNWGNPPQPPAAMFMEYSPEHQTPAIKGTVMKCDFCPDMARAGRLPYCAQGCPNKAIYYGDLEEDLATNGKDVVKLSEFIAQNAAYRLKEHLGTEPRVYYIPGYGQDAGRSPAQTGHKPTTWPLQDPVPGAADWQRNGAEGHW